MDKLSAMQTFVQIVEAGSFTRAAERMQLPKARVSQRLQALEAELGVRLLERTTRALRLTNDGRAYHERCVQLLADLEEAEQALRGDHARPSGVLRVDVVAAIARHVLAPALGDFSRHYPELAVHLHSRDRISHLLEDGIDCAIRGGPLPDASHVAISACTVHLGLYAAPECLARPGTPQAPEVLARLPRLGWVDQRSGGVLPWRLARDDGAGFDVPGLPTLAFDDGDAAIAAALGGAGVVVAAPFAVRAAVQSGTLCPVLPAWEAGQRTVSVLWPSRRQRSARLRCFVDWAVERLRHDPALALRPRDLVPAGTGRPKPRRPRQEAKGQRHHAADDSGSGTGPVKG
ncbi:MAG: LysR family transcriptional regulator [Inhella sp.]